MSYLVLARKWRPQGFADLVGQEPIVRVLSNAITQDKVAHAYVFSGPRGVGKTTTARILAKALNCEKGPTPAPCGVCPMCMAVADGHSVDVFEIDGASNNSVDDIRDLREGVKYAPSGGKHKIYIIDEAHMLSPAAFNALLKTLEEPPPSVVFVLATTEARKIPVTVMSRCQHLPFRRVSTEKIRERLRHIAASEGIAVSEQALVLIARAAEGSIRDSLTILDQAASFTDSVSEEDVLALLDVADFRTLHAAAHAVISGDRSGILALVRELVDQGADPRAFAKDLIKFFRDLLVVRIVADARGLIDATDDELAALGALAGGVSDEHLALILTEILKAESDVKTSFSPRVALEMSLVRTSYLSSFRDIKDAIASLSEGGAAAASSAPCPPSSPSQGTPSAADGRRSKRPAPYLSGASPSAARPAPEPKPAPCAPAPTGASEDAVGEGEAPEVAAPGADALGAVALFQGVLDNVEDMKLSSMLAKARPELQGDTLTLVFSGPDAEFCAGAVKGKSDLIARSASGLAGRHLHIEIHIKRTQAPARKDAAKEKVFSEPVIAQALDLFDGRVLNYSMVDDPDDPDSGG